MEARQEVASQKTINFGDGERRVGGACTSIYSALGVSMLGPTRTEGDGGM